MQTQAQGWRTCSTSREGAFPASSEMPAETCQACGALGTFQDGSAEGVQMPPMIGGDEGTGPVKWVGGQCCPGGGDRVPSATLWSRHLRAAFTDLGLRSWRLGTVARFQRTDRLLRRPRERKVERAELRGAHCSGQGSSRSWAALPSCLVTCRSWRRRPGTQF